MSKLIIAVLVIVLVGFGIYFEVFQKGQSPVSLPISVTRESVTTPEDDLTALEKDLADLEADEAGFMEELNNL